MRRRAGVYECIDAALPRNGLRLLLPKSSMVPVTSAERRLYHPVDRQSLLLPASNALVGLIGRLTLLVNSGLRHDLCGDDCGSGGGFGRGFAAEDGGGD